jgi:diadenosine tetraphosphate (Ap4A) HIT family hydrolase
MTTFAVNGKCTFCNQYIWGTTPNFWAINWGKKYGQTSDVICESDHNLAVAGLGALSEGYVLLVPKAHYLSVAQLPEPMVEDLERLKQHIRSAIGKIYASAVFFEHGAVTENKRGGACIDHVHVHAFPCQIDLRQFLQKDFPETRIQSLKELKLFAEINQPYIFYENQLGEMFVYETPAQIPSQYIRRRWAEALGRSDEWDWALFIGENEVTNTITKLKNLFRETKLVLESAT